MAWRAKGKNNADLIKQLIENKIIKINDDKEEKKQGPDQKVVRDAMLKVDRGDFAPRDPYMDCPQSIGLGATISAPHMHAYALIELMDNLKEGCKALDVGSGSGYLVACMAYMVGSKGKIVGIEHMKELYELGKINISKSHKELLNTKNIELICGDGRLGYEKEAPYDCIHVGAAAQLNVAPVLTKQLKNGGTMVIPVELAKNNQVFRRYYKDQNGKVTWTNLMGVRYVPLTDEKSQRRKK